MKIQRQSNNIKNNNTEPLTVKIKTYQIKVPFFITFKEFTLWMFNHFLKVYTISCPDFSQKVF